MSKNSLYLMIFKLTRFYRTSSNNEEWFKGLNTKVNFAVNTYDRVSLDSALLRTMAETDFSSNTDIDLARYVYVRLLLPWYGAGGYCESYQV